LLDSKSLDEVTARDYLQLIARENSRLSRLIDNFLAFSRMERNKRAFDFTEVSAAKIASDAGAAVHERFDVPGCRFTLQLPPELPTVTADPDAMVTALVNLLDNAYKYSGEPKEIVLSAGADNGNVFYSVSDNGIGLEARETKRIFDRFYQVDQRTSQATGGCGLGLSIVKFIVTAHHGEVQVQSEPGKGSTFKITLPLHGAERE
jgi:signal transduction histidine kinase